MDEPKVWRATIVFKTHAAFVKYIETVLDSQDVVEIREVLVEEVEE